ncbi:DUF3787 domain-containing protein [Aminipila butyrica]|uniref:DUF3787 domain-containing protein n=1 Tax=Aminipila butyrica TaxID=433296 RepID=A0A858BXA4_9FIRM|nr:DUF3787 domain-containing protein [Aminipila butyrica]QIB69354.1 DUF3787 domain-containing protein [Aminipila butyrica]
MKKEINLAKHELKGQRLAEHIENAGSNRTAALTDTAWIVEDTNMTIPSERAVEEAKDWVDNGSQL